MTLQIGIVGLGIWGERHAETIRRAGGTLRACFARTTQTRDEFAARYDAEPVSTYDELLEMPDVDAVIIATPHTTHADLACRAAEAGKHILIEKPLTLNVPDGRRVLEAARKAGVVLQVAHFRRRVAAVRELKDMADSQLGLIHHVEATMMRPVPPNDKRWNTSWRMNLSESPMGGLTVMAVHWIDALQYMLGPVDSVFARSKKLVDDEDLDDATVLMLEFKSGPLAYIGTSLRVPRKFSMKLMGTKGAAWTDDTGDFDATRLYFQGIYDKYATELPVERGDALMDQYRDFVRSCEGSIQPETDGLAGLDTVAVLEAAIASNRQGVPVKIDRSYCLPDAAGSALT